MQAVWRGHWARATHPRAKRFAELRKRLAKAKANADGLAHRSLAARTRVGLEGLLAATHLTSVRAWGSWVGDWAGFGTGTQCTVCGPLFLPGLPSCLHCIVSTQHQHTIKVGRAGALVTASPCSPSPLQAVSSLETLAHCMEASTTCCSMVADAGGTAALLRLVQSASRDKSCQDALRWALLCLGHLCRQSQRADEVFRQEGLLGLLADLLQHHRDREVGGQGAGIRTSE